MTMISNSGDAAAERALPLWLVYEDEIETWSAAQDAAAREWLSAHHFKAERHRVLLLPDARGAVAAAVGGLGKRSGGLSL
jgi:hypothetical protein